ncbi:hypothetical protein F2P79_005676 [Pimephales promelas]|nr:hypothetical protein F2P79_005676 [Pimephales promelas]
MFNSFKIRQEPTKSDWTPSLKLADTKRSLRTLVEEIAAALYTHAFGNHAGSTIGHMRGLDKGFLEEVISTLEAWLDGVSHNSIDGLSKGDRSCLGRDFRTVFRSSRGKANSPT